MSDRPCVTTKSGIRVFKNWRDNIRCKDKSNKALTRKAESDREKYGRGEAKGLSRFGSESSEDALTWSVFRTLELKKKMGIFYNLINVDDELQGTIFWTRDTTTEKEDEFLTEILDDIEPRHLWKVQQTEPDVILVGKKTVVFNESKLGRTNTKILGWSRGKTFEARHRRYEGYLDNIFTETFKSNYENLGVKFYQLMRNVIVGERYARRLGKVFHLSVIVSELNTAKGYLSHKDKFEEFLSYLINKSKGHFTTWQEMQVAMPEEPELEEFLESHPCLVKGNGQT